MEEIPGESRHPALALANTVLRRHGGVVDLIAGPEEAGRWLADRSGPVGWSGRVDDGGLVALRELRGAIRELFAARVAGGRPPAAALVAVNGSAGLAPAVPTLAWEVGPVRRVEAASGTAFERALARLAADAIELVAGADSAALAECGAADCIRFLVRNHGKRQWCSTRCGDRVRAARHYARTRQG